MKKRKLLYRRILAMFVTFMMTFMSMPLGVFADEQSEQEAVNAAIAYIESLDFTPDATVVDTDSASAFASSLMGEIRTSYNVGTVKVVDSEQEPTVEAAGFFSFHMEIVGKPDNLYRDNTQVITVDIPRLKSSDATLSDLKVNDTTVAGFNTSVTEYTMTVLNEVSNITISATTTHEGASRVISGESLIAAGATNDYSVAVTAEDGTQQTYTITVTRELSDFNCVTADTSALSLGLGTILGDNAGQHSVTGNLSLPTEGANGTTITWSSSNTAVISNTGVVTRPSYSEANVSLTLTAVVEKGSATSSISISITVLKADPSLATPVPDARIIDVDGSPEMEVFWDSVPEADSYDVSYVVVTIGEPLPAYSVPVNVQSLSAVISGLEPGTIYSFKVVAKNGMDTSANGVVEKAFVLPSNVATLTGISVNDTPIAGFVSTTTEYTVEVPFETNEITILPTKTDPNASASYYADDEFNTIEETYNIVVTAEDGETTETYIVTVRRAAQVYGESLVLTSDGLTYDSGLLTEDTELEILGGGSYTYAEGILTLTNVNFTTTAATAFNLTAVPGVNLNIAGTNRIKTIYSGAGDVYGVFGAGVNITGSGTLTIDNSGSVTTSDNFGYYGYSGALTSISLTDATVQFIGGQTAGVAARSRGISDISILTINSGSLTATGGAVADPTSAAYGSIGLLANYVRIYGGTAHFEGYTRAASATINTLPAAYTWTADTATGTYPTSAYTWANTQKKIIITAATGVTPATASFNKVSAADIELKYSLAAGVTLDSITVGDDTLTLSDYEIEGNTITIFSTYLDDLDNDTYTITLNTSGDTDPTVTLTVTNYYSKGLVLTSDGLTFDSGLLATSPSTPAVLGGGSYTYEGGILTLTNVNFTTSALHGLDLSAVDGVTVNLVGSNSIISNRTSGSNPQVVYSTGALTINGPGSLTVTTGNHSSGMCAIQGVGLTINSGTVTVITGNAPGAVNRGLYSGSGALNINGGTITVTTGTGRNSYPIGTNGGTINVTDGNITATAGTATENSYGLSASAGINITGGNVTASGANGAFSITPSFPAVYKYKISAAGGFTDSSTAPTFTTYAYIETLTGVSPTTVTFNKAVPEDVTFSYSLAAGAHISSVLFNSSPIGRYTHYTISGNNITVLASLLSGYGTGSYPITLNTSDYVDPTVTLTVANVYPKGLVLKSDGLYYDNTKLAASDSKLGGGSYEYSESVLTLDDVDFTTSAGKGLDLSEVDGVTVRLSGTNSIASTLSNDQSTGVFSTGSFTIDGTGSLTARSGNTSGNMSAGIGSTNGGVTVNGGTIEAIGGNSSNFSYGINAVGDITITAGIVTSRAGATSVNNYGIDTGSEIIITGGTVTATGEDGAFFGTLSLPAAYIYKLASTDDPTALGATPPTFTTYAYIETATGVSPTAATFNKADAVPSNIVLNYSLAAGVTLQSVSIDDAVLPLTTGYTKTASTITLLASYLEDLDNDTYTITLNTSGSVDPTVTLTVAAIYSKGLVLNSATSRLEYDNAEVTSEILGGGSYSYNGSTKTLTLTGVNFTTSANIGLSLSSVGSAVTVLLSGENSLASTKPTGSSSALASPYNITIGGTGSLTATAGDNAAISIGIQTEGNLTIESGTVSAIGGDAPSSYGIQANGYVFINGGEVTATGETRAFNKGA
ncbi:MAG: carbohydrate-binding domain-containing protein [Ruminococcus sp.]|jgi:hypothetical protein|nr:carbohydrate-binding domain-containing protein [Ruminococcus sp.]